MLRRALSCKIKLIRLRMHHFGKGLRGNLTKNNKKINLVLIFIKKVIIIILIILIKILGCNLMKKLFLSLVVLASVGAGLFAGTQTKVSAATYRVNHHFIYTLPGGDCGQHNGQN